MFDLNGDGDVDAKEFEEVQVSSRNETSLKLKYKTILDLSHKILG